MSVIADRLKQTIGIPPPRKSSCGVNIHLNGRGGYVVEPRELIRSKKAQGLIKEVADLHIGDTERSRRR